MSDDEQRVAEIRERAKNGYHFDHSAACDAWSDMNGSDCTCGLDDAREDIPWLLDRLRATEAELAVSRDLTEAWRGKANENRQGFETMRATATAAEARAAEAEAVIAEARLALEGESVAFGTSETNLYRSQRDGARRALSTYRAGADHDQ